MVADAGVSAYLAQTAHAPLAVMLAYLRPATLLAPALDMVVVAGAGVPAYLAQTVHAPWRVGSHICDPTHSLH